MIGKRLMVSMKISIFSAKSKSITIYLYTEEIRSLSPIHIKKRWKESTALFRVFDCSRFTNNRNFNVTWVIQFTFDLLRNVTRQPV